MPPDRAAAIDAADAWARGHGHRDITHCGATPEAAFLAGMAAERERCAQLAEQEAAHADLQVASEEARIVGAVLRNFAEWLRNPPEGTPDDNDHPSTRPV
jgi:hypothetical protein